MKPHQYKAGISSFSRRDCGVRSAMVRLFWFLFLLFPVPGLADTVLIYSSVNNLYGVNLTSNQETYLTSASLSATVNALAANSTDGLVYYGDETSIYYWDPALGTGPNSHVLINNFENGFIQVPIQNLNSTGGSFLNGKYYAGSETDNGFIEDIYEFTMSSDGRQLVSARALDIHAACQCSEVQLGGFGDIAVIDAAGGPVIYGSSADLTGNGQGTHAGIWRFELSNNTFTLLGNGQGGQLANTVEGRIYTNLGNRIQELNINNGQISGQTLLTTANAIWDFTGGFSFDYGDAPDSYGGAAHLIDGLVGQSAHLGINPPDNEAYTQHENVGGNNGLGDDLNGIDDEDALVSVPDLHVGDTEFELTIDCSAGQVAAWIDFNVNGTFDFGERNINHPAQCVAGNAVFKWDGFQLTQGGASYLRIRSSVNASEVDRPTGFARSGEVEDYHVTIVDNSVSSGNCPAGNTSHIYRATDVPKSYRGTNGNPTISTINIPDSLIITDINVLNLQATHSTQRALYFVLQNGGDFAYLYGNTCWQNQRLNIGFDDEGVGGLACAPNQGELYRPQRTLSVYDGRDAQGAWEMRLYNYNRNNRGNINGWELEVCTLGTTSREPDMRLGKIADVNGRLVTITLALKNTGQEILKNIELTDDLDAAFGAGNYSVESPPVVLSGPTGFSGNAAYTGQPGSDSLLIATQALLPGEEVRVQFVVDVGFVAPVNGASYQNQANASALSESEEKIVDLSTTGFDFTTDQDNPTPINLESVLKISGVVFEDTSTNVQTSHDGIQQPQELSVSGRPVTLYDQATGAELATAITAADGSWSATVGLEYINQLIDIVVTPVSTTQFISESPLDSNTSNTDGKLSLLVQAEADANYVLVGLINKTSLQLSQSANIVVGALAEYHHTFSSPTHGQVKFSVNATHSSQGLGWSEELYHDQNCNQQVDASDYLINSVIDVAFEEIICLTVQVDTPANGFAGESQNLELTSYMLPSDFSATNHNVRFTNSNNDVSTLILEGVGNLVLKKSVNNITLGGQPVTQNTAKPGHILEYSITYTNNGDGGINDLEINDESPAYTLIEVGSIQCAQTPSPLTCVPSSVGSQISWQFQGSLPAGGSGEVTYRVKVD